MIDEKKLIEWLEDWGGFIPGEDDRPIEMMIYEVRRAVIEATIQKIKEM